MVWKANVLVVANVTATSPGLLGAMEAREQQGLVDFSLVMPSPGLGPAARQRAESSLETALQAMRGRGLTVDGVIGDADPLVAVMDVFDPRRHDEIIVSTLPAGVSRWLQIDLAQRLERATGVRVAHVMSSPPRPAPAVRQVPQRPREGVLTPLRVLGWGSERARPGRRPPP